MSQNLPLNSPLKMDLELDFYWIGVTLQYELRFWLSVWVYERAIRLIQTSVQWIRKRMCYCKWFHQVIFENIYTISRLLRTFENWPRNEINIVRDFIFHVELLCFQQCIKSYSTITKTTFKDRRYGVQFFITELFSYWVRWLQCLWSVDINSTSCKSGT